MRFFILTILLTSALHLTGQVDVKIYYTESSDGFTVYIDNNEFAPVTVEIDYDLRNLRLDVGDGNKVVVPANHKAFRAARLKVVDPRKPYQFSYRYSTNIGDHDRKEYDTEYLYRLPFASGKFVSVSQGYDGKFSHKDILALDFPVPVGTEIYAARGGVVVTVTERHDRNCTSPACMDFNNLIIIDHEDGTFAEYVHLRKGGAFVDAGDRVKQGQLIGESGNTGFSDGPHLHFAVFLPRMEGRVYLPTNFRVKGAADGASLEERRRYQVVD